MIARDKAIPIGLTGWRFWIIWVIATNIGFFSGLFAAPFVANGLVEPWYSGVYSASFALPTGLGQWLVLRLRIPGSINWMTATLVGWWVGATVLSSIFAAANISVGAESWYWNFSVSFFAGLLIGLFQFLVIPKESMNLRWWWVPLSGLAWLVFFPGAVCGLALMYMLDLKADKPFQASAHRSSRISAKTKHF